MQGGNMVRRVMLLAFVVLFLSSCGGSDHQVVQTPQPRDTQSEMDSIKSRFRKAYAELTCLANPGVDPQMSVVPLHSPEDFLKNAQKRSPERFSLALEVLKKYGFFTVDAFFDTMRTLKMDAEYWDSVENSFLDDLQKCK